MRIAATGWFYNASIHSRSNTIDELYRLQLVKAGSPSGDLYACPVSQACSFVDNNGTFISASNWAGVPRAEATPTPTPRPSATPAAALPSTATNASAARRALTAASALPQLDPATPGGPRVLAGEGSPDATRPSPAPGGRSPLRRLLSWAASGFGGSPAQPTARPVTAERVSAAARRLAAALVRSASKPGGLVSVVRTRDGGGPGIVDGAVVVRPDGSDAFSPGRRRAGLGDVDPSLAVEAAWMAATRACEGRSAVAAGMHGRVVDAGVAASLPGLRVLAALHDVSETLLGRNESAVTAITGGFAPPPCALLGRLRAHLGMPGAVIAERSSLNASLALVRAARRAAGLPAGTVGVDAARPAANQPDAVSLTEKARIAVPAQGIVLKCRQHHSGPVCGECEPGTFMQTDRLCYPCEVTGALSEVLLIALLAVLGAAAMGFCSHDCGSQAPYQTWTTAFARQAYNFLFIGAVVGSLTLSPEAEEALRCWDPLSTGRFSDAELAYCNGLFDSPAGVTTNTSAAAANATASLPLATLPDQPLFLAAINAPAVLTSVGINLVSESFSCVSSLRYRDGAVVWFLVCALLIVGMYFVSLLVHGLHAAAHAGAVLAGRALCPNGSESGEAWSGWVSRWRPYRIEAALGGLGAGEDARRRMPHLDMDEPCACSRGCRPWHLGWVQPRGRVMAAFLVAWYLVFTPLTAHVVSLFIVSRSIDGVTYLSNDFSVAVAGGSDGGAYYGVLLGIGLTSGSLFLVLFPCFILRTLAANDESLLDRAFGRTWSFIYDGYRLGLQNAGMDRQLITSTVAVSASMISRLEVADLRNRGLNEAQPLASDTIIRPFRTPCDDNDCFRSSVRSLGCWRGLRNACTTTNLASVFCCCCNCCCDCGKVCQRYVCCCLVAGSSSDESPDSRARSKQLHRFQRMRLAGLAVVEYMEALERFDKEAAQAVGWGVARHPDASRAQVRAFLLRQQLPRDPRARFTPNVPVGRAEVEAMRREGADAVKSSTIFSQTASVARRLKVQRGAVEHMEGQRAAVPALRRDRSAPWERHLESAPDLKRAELLAAWVHESVQQHEDTSGKHEPLDTRTAMPPAMAGPPGDTAQDLDMLRLHRIRKAMDQTVEEDDDLFRAVESYRAEADTLIATQARAASERTLSLGGDDSGDAAFETPQEIATRLSNSRLRARRTFTEFIEAQVGKSFATWEIQLLVRRLVFIVVELLAAGAEDVRAFVVGIVTLIFLILHVRSLPFESADLNVTETLTLSAALARQLASLAALMVAILETQAAITGDTVSLLGFKSQTAVAGLAFITSVLTIINMVFLFGFLFGHGVASLVGACIPKPDETTRAPLASKRSGAPQPEDTVLRAERPILDFVSVFTTRTMPDTCFPACCCCVQCFASRRSSGHTTELGRPVSRQNSFVPRQSVRTALLLRYLNPVIRTDSDALHLDDMMRVRRQIRRYLGHLYRPEEPRESEATAKYQDLDEGILGKELRTQRYEEAQRLYRFLLRATDSNINPALASLVVDSAGGEGSLNVPQLRAEAREETFRLQSAIRSRQALSVKRMSDRLVAMARRQGDVDRMRKGLLDRLEQLDADGAAVAWGAVMASHAGEMLGSDDHKLASASTAVRHVPQVKTAMRRAGAALRKAERQAGSSGAGLPQLHAEWVAAMTRSAREIARERSHGLLFTDMAEAPGGGAAATRARAERAAKSRRAKERRAARSGASAEGVDPELEEEEEEEEEDDDGEGRGDYGSRAGGGDDGGFDPDSDDDDADLARDAKPAAAAASTGSGLPSAAELASIRRTLLGHLPGQTALRTDFDAVAAAEEARLADEADALEEQERAIQRARLSMVRR